MDDETVRASRVIVKVTAIAQPYALVEWGNQRARIDLRFLTEDVSKQMRVGAELHAQVHGNQIYNLRPVPTGTSIKQASRHRLIVR